MTNVSPLRESQTPTSSQTRTHATPSGNRPARIRTAKACRLCNEKRVKCDASERGTPCTRCEKRGESGCTLIQSRRGIYERKPRRQQARASSKATELNGTGVGLSSARDGNSGASQESNIQVSPPTELGHNHSLTAPARVLSQQDTSSGNADASINSKIRDASWSTVFENLLQRREYGEALVDKGSIAYVGEAFPLGIILDGPRNRTGRPLLHHSELALTSEANTASHDTTNAHNLLPEDIAFLETKQTFTAPSDHTLDTLIRLFLERFFPFYPVVNSHELYVQHKARNIPWILLHAICFVSATFCPLRFLQQAGFEERKQARSHFYNKAKALFDIGYERSKVVTLQASILLSFWGGSPNQHCNFYTWISTGVTIAETVGCHRSMAGLNMTSQDRSLLKRLWWILVMRDATCASMHGRPFRINLDHCDADDLTLEDFEFDPSHCLSSDNTHLSGLYHIHATKLALLLRQIVTVRFYPRSQGATSPSVLHEMLIDWRNRLPVSLQWMDNDSTHVDIYRTTLCVLYNHNVILSQIKPEFEASNYNALSPSSWLGDEVASRSAQQIASLACSMVTDSEDLVPPHELFHGLFIACVVFFVQARSSGALTASLGRSGLTNCKMALHAHRDTWDASSWITHIFGKALTWPMFENTPTTMADVPADVSTPRSHNGFNNLDSTEPNSFISNALEGWPNHLFLGDLFDPSMSTATFATPVPGYGQESGIQYY